MRTLPRSFYSRNTAVVARQLLGKYLVRKIGGKRIIGRIVETEAYFENDPASHAFKGKTKRCAPMFEHPGHAYVYFIYGNHYCLNVVTERYGKAGAVLIRALEPIKNIRSATNGPGKLTKALKIDKTFNRADLTNSKLVITEGKNEAFIIERSGRIGLSKASTKQFRFYIKSNHFVSKPRA